MTHYTFSERLTEASLRNHGATHDRNKGTREREERGKWSGGTRELVGHFAFPTYEARDLRVPAPSPDQRQAAMR